MSPSIAVVWTAAILYLPNTLRTISSQVGSEA
jgi:hypothetical protein